MCKYRLGEEQGETGVRAVGKAESLSVTRMLRAPLSKKVPPGKMLWEMFWLELRAESSAQQMKPPRQSLLDAMGITQVKSHSIKR